MRLASHLARLKRQCASAYFQTYFFKHQTRPFFSDSSEADFRYERQLSGTTSRKDIAKKNERNSIDPTFSRVRRPPANRPLRKPPTYASSVVPQSRDTDLGRAGSDSPAAACVC